MEKSWPVYLQRCRDAVVGTWSESQLFLISRVSLDGILTSLSVHLLSVGGVSPCLLDSIVVRVK